MSTDLINVLATLQECSRQDGSIYETKLDRARGQLEHDSVVGLRDASQPFQRARSEQLVWGKGKKKESQKWSTQIRRRWTDMQESVERCPGILDAVVDHDS